MENCHCSPAMPAVSASLLLLLLLLVRLLLLLLLLPLALLSCLLLLTATLPPAAAPRVDMVSEASKDASHAASTFVLRPALPGAPSSSSSTDDANHLMFKHTAEGGMELLPTALSGQQAKEVEMFIGRFRSIPAFTANFTMELFQRSTQGA